MKRAVILCLFILIGSVWLVKCVDDAGELDTDDEVSEDFDTDGQENTFDDTEFGTDGGESDDVVSADDNDDDDESSLKCLVCRAVIEVMLYEVEKIDPRKRIQVTSTKSIQYSKSETYLAELMEDICEYEDTFATIRQVIVQNSIIKNMLKNGGAVEEAPVVTETVNHLCLEILDDNDAIILKEFMREKAAERIDDIVCTQTAQYCKKSETGDSNGREEL